MPAVTEETTVRFLGIEMTLPPFWLEHPREDGFREFRERPDGSNGRLEVTQLPQAEVEDLSKLKAIHPRAAKYGRGPARR